MAKSFLWKFLFVFGIVVVAALWVLSVFVPDTFGFFNLSWAVAIVSGFIGVSLVLRGMFEKNLTVIKKTNIFLGAGFFIIALFALISVIALPENAVAPIIAAILAVALLLGVIVTGGKKWDAGDNKKAGYKNYHQRKAEEEKKKNK